MKRSYETFEEIADHFTGGHSITHTKSSHTPDECIGWQQGVQEFAKFLDLVGMKMVISPDIYDELWDKARDKMLEDIDGL